MNVSNPAPPRSTGTYLPHVDRLRETWLPGGFIGVDVFFVISGFVVSLSVSHWSGGGIGSFMGRFHARRLPAADRACPARLPAADQPGLGPAHSVSLAQLVK